MNYATLKRSMVGSLGKRDMEPTLEIVEVKTGDRIIFMTDGGLDYFENPATDTFDTRAFIEALGPSSSSKERLDHIRQQADERRHLDAYSQKKEGDDFTAIEVVVG
jgi:serine phosphatase RsbU (regulator of sigma subunit)